MMSVAAIDVGSSAIRLLIVQIAPHGIVHESFTKRYPIRLGADVFATGAVGAETTARVVEAFSDCKSHLQHMGVHRYRAVATSAMREAANGAAVVRLVRARTGLDIEVISGTEEGRLIRRMLMRSLGSVPRAALLIDLGGGSLELERGAGVRGRSLPFGTVRLLQRFPELAKPMSPQALASLQRAIHVELKQLLGRVRPAELAIATGGNLETIARLAPQANMAVPAINVRRLSPLCRRIARLSAAERSTCFGIRADRADLILPAALVMHALAVIFEPEALIVPGTGIREAVLWALVFEEMRAQRGLTVPHRSTAARRALLARRLFAQLSAQHRLWPPAAVALEAGAALLDTLDAAAGRVPTVELRARLLAMRLCPNDDDSARIAVAAALLACGARLRAKCALSTAERHAARTLAAIITLAAALARRGSPTSVKVNLLRDPIVIEVGLPQRLSRAAVVPLERALGRRIRVR